MALSASPAAAFRLHVSLPPYKGTAATPSNYVQTSGRCKAAAIVASEHWVPRSGNATLLASSVAHGCAATALGTPYAYASADTQLQVLWPFRVVTGVHNLTVNFSYAFTIQMPRSGAFACPLPPNVPGKYTYSYCSFNRSAAVEWGFEVFDQTNGSTDSSTSATSFYFYNYSFQGNNSYCNAGKCVSNNYSRTCPAQNGCTTAGALQAGTTSLYLNTAKAAYGWTLVGTHHYWVVLWFDVSTQVNMAGYRAGNVAGAAVNAAALGNTGWQVTSISIR